ncbi:hypothetical protein BCR42DRAFT_358113 [Absidia repens]|uniref:Ras guanine nucleotide exchange factor domain-containing protein n=1 Tax=Absidia repens TaxID=90262 RepID=A0A1X2I5X2_9FUNG|nr:hypothetical protein BCR42DRAFT_358113 [Absidia repens]
MTSPISSLPHTSPDLNSHFVQALHDFFPANAPADNNSACLFFQRGAIIEVYNRDDSGWWDGVTDGLRGWFPSNHVGHLGQLKRHSVDYSDLQGTSQLKEFEAWRHGSISTANTPNNVIDPNSSDASVLPTAQYNLNDNGSMSCRSYSESSNTSMHHSYDGSNIDNADTYNYQYTPDRVELARSLLNEDREKFGAATPESLTNKKSNTLNLNYLLEDANNRISDLVDDCGQEHLSSNIQLVIFQVVSSIRSVLAAANTVSKDSPLLKTYPDLARQRKNALSSLSRLVLKGKELHALCQVGDDGDDDGSRRKVQHDIPSLANQLLMDMNLFESVLRSIILAFPTHIGDVNYGNEYDIYSNDDSDDSTQEEDQYSSNNNLAATLGDKNHTHGTLDSIELASGFQQHITTDQPSTASPIAKEVPFSDAHHIIQTVLDYQTCIDEIVVALMITVEEYVSARQRATHMLEMTRKAVEAVRTFLAMVEHVCSNVGDLDYNHRSVIPENPQLVSLVLAKEAVYSAITNLVTAVRALIGPKDQQTDNNDDLCHLQSCCQSVTQSTSDCASCVRICLCVDGSPVDLPIATSSTVPFFEMRDKLETSADARRNQTLSILGRKATSLNALQRQFSNNEGGGDNENSLGTTTKTTNISSNTCNSQGGISTDTATETLDSTTTKATGTKDISLLPAIQQTDSNTTHTGNQISESDVEKLDMQQRQLAASSSEPSSSSSVPVLHDLMDGYRRHRTHSIPSMLSESSQSRSSLGARSTRSNHSRVSRSHAVTAQRRSQATMRSSLTTSVSSIHTINGTTRPLSDRSSMDSFNMTPLTTPEAMSPVTEFDDDIPLGKQLSAKLDIMQRQTRPRSSSINALAIVPPTNEQQQLASTQRVPLPPIPPSPMEPPSDLKPTSSKSTPTTDQSPAPTKSRRPRGMSVSALRMSIKQKYDDRTANGISAKEVTNTKSINRISSLSSLRSTSQSSINETKTELDPWFVKQRSFTEDEIIVNADGQLTGASIEALVEKLTSHEKSPDLVFTRAFFYNFRLFTTPPAFIDLLIQRFNVNPPSDPVLSEDDVKLWQNRVLVPVRLRVYNVIKTWLENYYQYKQDDVESQLMAFTTGDMQDAMPVPAKRMADLIRRTFEIRGHSMPRRKMSYALCSSSHTSVNSEVNGSNVSLSEHNPPRPPLNTKSSSSHLSLSSGSSLFSDLSLFGSDSHNNHNTSSSSSSSEQVSYPPINLTRSLRNTLRKAVSQDNLALVHINDFDCMELARQFTLMESALFCQITPYELIGQEFKKKAGQSAAIHIKAMIQTSTQVTSWISDSILREQDAKRRAQMIKFWIKVGDCCLQMNNYNTLMAIRSALDSTSIRRLKKSWDHLSTKYKAMLEPIYRATDSARNFAEYRTRLKMAVAPCLPFLGVYLTDMTFIDDGNSDNRTTPSGRSLINFDKYIKTTRVLNEIDQFQIPYKLLEVEEIQRYLSRCLETVVMDEQLFYNRSVALEPRQEEPTTSDIRHTISQFT